MPLDPARRAALLGSSLRVLAEEAGADVVGEPAALGANAGLLAADGTAWVLLAEQPASSLGAALAWTVRREATALQILAREGTGVLARRAGHLTFPVRVAHVVDDGGGRVLVPAVAEPLPTATPVAERHRELVGLIEAGGAVPVEEHGVLAGEVAGLEVCRVVDDATTGEVRLEVGVGAHDREAFQLLHGDRPTVEALADVVRAVAAHRTAGAPQHPLNQLAASRRLRERLVRDPSLVGATQLVAAEPPLPRGNVKDEVPCVAREVGTDRIVVCTSGVDLEVVPWAGDAAAAFHAGSCLVAAPERDVLEIQRRLAALLRVPTHLVPIP